MAAWLAQDSGVGWRPTRRWTDRRGGDASARDTTNPYAMANNPMSFRSPYVPSVDFIEEISGEVIANLFPENPLQ